MRPITYSRADTALAAIKTARSLNVNVNTPATNSSVQFLAGGTTLLDLMKLDVMQPQALVDINGMARSDQIEVTPQGVRFGPLVSMAHAASHEAIVRDYPVIAQSLQLAASAQLRNMASLAGNLLQRTRCAYFRDTSWSACNKRVPGSGCAAREGVNRQHAVLGTSEQCIATYPGDFAQALIALEARIDIQGVRGKRTLPVAQLHRLPGSTPHIETVLAPGELITGITVPAAPWTPRSLYLKIRDRVSYQFALASAAVALHLEEGIVREARIALGGVATVPWRAREAEAVLKAQRWNDALARTAAQAAFAGARTHRENLFKVPLGIATLERALLQTAHMEI